MHIELTEMLRCPEPHQEEFLVLSTGEMVGRMVRSGVVGCPVCTREYLITQGIVDFAGAERSEQGAGRSRTPERPAPGSLLPAPETLQALLELSGPGGFVVLVGSAARHGAGLAALMAGIHFVGINPPDDVEPRPVLSLLRARGAIPLRQAIARGAVVGAELATAPWLAEAHRVLLRGRRLVAEREHPEIPDGLTPLAAAQGLWVGAKR